MKRAEAGRGETRPGAVQRGQAGQAAPWARAAARAQAASRAQAALGVLAVMLLAPGPAWAQSGEGPARPELQPQIDTAADQDDKPWARGVPMDRREAAREIFLVGNRLVQDALFARAASRYREAIAIWDHPAFHYNLAIAQINLDQPIEAYRSLERAMRFGDGPLGASKYEQAQSYRGLLERQLARIDIECEQAGVVVALGGKPLFTGPGRHQAVVLPGGHQVTAGKPGHLSESRQVVLGPGEEARVELAPLAYEMVQTRRWETWRPWAVVGAGAGVALAGGVLHWRASVDIADFDRTFESLCPPGCPDEQLADDVAGQLERGRWLQRAAMGAYVAGGVTLVVGTALVYLNQTHMVPSPEATRTVRLAPIVAPGAVGVIGGLAF